MNYIDYDDYWARQWQLEAEAEDWEIQQQNIELQNATGVDMPRLGGYLAWIDFVDCISFPEEVPF